jgi:hypothetical protein
MADETDARIAQMDYEEQDNFYDSMIKPKLSDLTSALRVDQIQQKLLQEDLITDDDDQMLKAERTPNGRAVYFLDLLKQWDGPSFMKLFQIIRDSAKSCPAHRTVVQLLKLDSPETMSMSKVPRGKPSPIPTSSIPTPSIPTPIPASPAPTTIAVQASDAIRHQTAESYPMTANPRGIALIINNKNFGATLSTRTGTDIDAATLQKLFDWLKFTVRRQDSLTTVHIKKVIKELAEEDHSNYDCLIVAILSHGENDCIYGTDESLVSVETLTNYFKFTSSLRGKPKLFFLQACRGIKQDVIAHDGLDEADATPTQEKKVLQKVLQYDQTDADSKLASLPAYADFLLSYATTPGYVSWRNRLKGSWYVEALNAVFSEHARREDLLSMLTMVNRLIATEYQSTCDGGTVKQIPGPVSMLTKKLYFRPML